MNIQNVEYLLALHQINGLGPIRLKALMDYYQDPKLAWEAPEKELSQIGLPANVVKAIVSTRGKFDIVKNFGQLEKSGIKFITVYDDKYPSSLKQIYDPPTILYYQGEFPAHLNHAIAVVGTRKMTGYGRIVTEKFVTNLATAGLVIVSGLARGVDTFAHQITVENQGATIAVLGGGLNYLFPPENKTLADKIVSCGAGCVISEYAPDYPSLAGNFPSRNRIISGLSQATLVTEAAEDSGSLITAKCALEQGREVFAIPGPITSQYSQGTALLIKQGAKMVTAPEEILETLGIQEVISEKGKEISIENLTETEGKVLQCLENENQHLDEVCRRLQLSSAEVSAALIKMEIKGIVKNLGGGNYIRA